MHEDLEATTHVILVVEDEVLTRMVAASALKRAGFEVVELEHADAARAHLEAEAEGVNAIFTDIHVRGEMDGLALAQHTRRRWPWIALLIASGGARPTSRELPNGARFLPKPYDPAHAVSHLHEMFKALRR